MQAQPNELRERLRAAGLRATGQRLDLAGLLFAHGNRHVTAEQLHQEARAAGVKVSLATVYNTLHQFTTSGLLREIAIDPRRSYFDTKTIDHHHFFFEEEGRLEDIPTDRLSVRDVPPAPAGTRVQRVDVIVRVSRN